MSQLQKRGKFLHAHQQFLLLTLHSQVLIGAVTTHGLAHAKDHKEVLGLALVLRYGGSNHLTIHRLT